MLDKISGRPCGFGFITFTDPEVADKVEVKRTIPREDMHGRGVSRTGKVFVGGLPLSLNEDDLREYFSPYGNIVEHQIMLDHKTGRSRGFGFVTFDTEIEIKKAEPKRSGFDASSDGRFCCGAVVQDLLVVLLVVTVLDALRYSERKSEGRQRTASYAKRVRTDDYEMGIDDSVHDTCMNDKVNRSNKRSRSTSSPMKHFSPGDGGSVFSGEEQTASPQTSQEDYTKFSIQKLKQELTNHNFGAELSQLKNPNKKTLLLCMRDAF
ncbi:hypothetical protein ACS0TY_035007 [Phlomoides rotata]